MRATIPADAPVVASTKTSAASANERMTQLPAQTEVCHISEQTISDGMN